MEIQEPRADGRIWVNKVPGARVNTIVARVGIGQAKFVATHDSKIGCSDNNSVYRPNSNLNLV